MNQNVRILMTAVLVGIAALLTDAVWAQTATPQGVTNGQGLSEEKVQQYVNKYEYYLRHLDTNHNGFLEQQEVEGRGGILAGKMAQKAGVELTFPMPIHRIREGLIRRLRSPTGATPPAIGSGATPSSPSTPVAAPGDSADGSPESKVPGFGVHRDESSVPGFGGDSESAGGSSPGSAPRKSSSSHPSSSGERVDYRIRRYAQSLLKQYDKNRNGKLEKEEWSRMRGDPKAADRNKDGIVTLDELTQRLAKYSRDRHEGSSSHSSRSSGSSTRSSSSSRSSDGEKGKTYRFLTPTERLPSGLPSWFAQRDADGDGQVSMAEYSQSWTKSKAAEFKELDPNGDGVITPAECLSEGDGE